MELCSSLILFPRKPQDQTENDTNDDAGGDGKIKTEVLFLNDNITRQTK